MNFMLTIFGHLEASKWTGNNTIERVVFFDVKLGVCIFFLNFLLRQVLIVKK